MGLFGKKKESVPVSTHYPAVTNGKTCGCCGAKIAGKTAYELPKDDFYANEKFITYLLEVLKKKYPDVVEKCGTEEAYAKLQEDFVETLKKKETSAYKHLCTQCARRFL